MSTWKLHCSVATIRVFKYPNPRNCLLTENFAVKKKRILQKLFWKIKTSFCCNEKCMQAYNEISLSWNKGLSQDKGVLNSCPADHLPVGWVPMKITCLKGKIWRPCVFLNVWTRQIPLPLCVLCCRWTARIRSCCSGTVGSQLTWTSWLYMPWSSCWHTVLLQVSNILII